MMPHGTKAFDKSRNIPAQSKSKVPSVYSQNDIDYLLAFVLKKEQNLL